MTKKNYTVVIPEKIKKQVDELPEDVKDELMKIFDGFANGTIDPMAISKPVKMIECGEKLPCAECGSKDISWVLEIEDEEVYYNCNTCQFCGWMSLEEYEDAKENDPEIVFKDDKD